MHPGRRSRAGVQGHQHAHQGARAEPPAEDYYNDKVLEDTDVLYTGVAQLPASFWSKHGKDMESWQQGGFTLLPHHRADRLRLIVNQFVYLDDAQPFYAQVKEIRGKTATLAGAARLLACQERRMGHHRAQPRAELRAQPADGPGVRLRLAASARQAPARRCWRSPPGLAQTLETKRFSEIIVTRATVPVGEDIGFLPGTEEEKMAPVDGRARGQPRGAQQVRRCCRRMGPRRDQRPDPHAHPHQVD